MDGHFVPNITIGPAVTAAVRAATDLPLDVHLMIERPELYLEAFADAGADYLTVHVEACTHLHRAVERIRMLDMRPGVTLNPATPAEAIAEMVPYLDLALVMSVNPGFGGQSYIPSSTAKIARLRAMLDERGTAGSRARSGRRRGPEDRGGRRGGGRHRLGGRLRSLWAPGRGRRSHPVASRDRGRLRAGLTANGPFGSTLRLPSRRAQRPGFSVARSPTLRRSG